MREIKFRGKDKRTGFFEYGSYLKNDFKNEDTEHFIASFDTDILYLIDHKTLGQYIKTKDFDGYEGDIVRDTEEGELGVVSYDEDSGTFCIRAQTQVFYFDDLAIEWEVIGNKYDNPELYNELLSV